MSKTAVKQAQSQTDEERSWNEFVVANPAPVWLSDVREKGMTAFSAQGLPTKKAERYKYTDIPRTEAGRYFPQVKSPIKTTGHLKYVTPISGDAPEWVRERAVAAPAGEEQYKDMALWHAANAFLRDGIIVDVPKNTTGEAPLEIEIAGDGFNSFVPRMFIRVGENAELTIIERHTGKGAYWNNSLSQICLEKGARLRHYRIQDNSAEAIYTQNTHVTQAADSTYEACVLTTGSELSRNQIHVELLGAGAEVYLSGLNLLQDTQHGDTTITIEHKAPNCHSNQLYKTIVDDKAHCVFQGKVHVHQIAQKTDGYQLSNALVLTSTATMDTKPELEIYADDVKCSHGSTTGQIDNAPLFYLRSRGLNEAQARMLLMQAFLGPVIDNIKDENIQELFGDLSLKWLEMQTGK